MSATINSIKNSIYYNHEGEYIHSRTEYELGLYDNDNQRTIV